MINVDTDFIYLYLGHLASTLTTSVIEKKIREAGFHVDFDEHRYKYFPYSWRTWEEGECLHEIFDCLNNSSPETVYVPINKLHNYKCKFCCQCEEIAKISGYNRGRFKCSLDISDLWIIDTWRDETDTCKIEDIKEYFAENTIYEIANINEYFVTFKKWIY